MEKARVDILLPYWGDFSLLKEAVDSVIAQTEQNWNLLIVDDCYPSDEARSNYSKHTDKRIHYIRHKKNIGLVKNYNYALSKAVSEHCVLLGCDDKLLPNYIEAALKRVGNADYYHPGVTVIDGHGLRILPAADRIKKFLRPKAGLHSGEHIVTSLCHGNWTYFPSIMWKVETLRRIGFDVNKPNTQDLLTQIEIFCSEGSMVLDDTVSFNYRRSASSFSSKAKAGTRFNEESEVYQSLARRFSKLGWKRAAVAARLHLTVRLHRLMP